MSRTPIDGFAKSKLAALERRRLRRELIATDRTDATVVERDGHALVSFACNDYLGLAHDPATIAASIEATGRAGAGAGAARLISGNHSLYSELEARLATLKGTEDAVAFGSGYLTNIAVIPVFAAPQDLVVIDELSHACIRAGATLSRATVAEFRHNDPSHLRRLLGQNRSTARNCLVVTEGVFSMDGDLAPLPDLGALCAEHDAWLMTDDAHGFGVVGNGRGSTFAHNEPVAVDLQMGTLSKAAGSYGGYLCAGREVCELIRNRAAAFVYTTGLPPGVVAASIEATRIIERDPARCARPVELARRFAHAVGLPAAQSPIVPLVLGAVDAALAASDSLAAAGYLVPAIRPPTVPAGTARLRFSFSAAHRDQDVDGLIASVNALGIAA